MGGLMAARMGNRMQMRQGYRTMSRMQRRRSYMENKMGMREDFQSPEDHEQQQQQAPPPPPPPAAPSYTDELAKLAQLVQQGVITQQDFDAKKKQLLGI
jgi:hypothetical protein